MRSASAAAKFGLELAEPAASQQPLHRSRLKYAVFREKMGGETCFPIVQAVNTLVKKRKRTLTNGSAAVRTDKVSNLLPNQETKKNIFKDTNININMESSPKKFIMQVFSDQLKYMGR